MESGFESTICLLLEFFEDHCNNSQARLNSLVAILYALPRESNEELVKSISAKVFQSIERFIEKEVGLSAVDVDLEQYVAGRLIYYANIARIDASRVSPNLVRIVSKTQTSSTRAWARLYCKKIEELGKIPSEGGIYRDNGNLSVYFGEDVRAVLLQDMYDIIYYHIPSGVDAKPICSELLSAATDFGEPRYIRFSAVNLLRHLVYSKMEKEVIDMILEKLGGALGNETADDVKNAIRICLWCGIHVRDRL